MGNLGFTYYDIYQRYLESVYANFDPRILSVNYSHKETSILIVQFIDGNLNLQMQWKYKNYPLSEMVDFINNFQCTKLINNHKYLVEKITGVELIDLKELGENDSAHLDDFFLDIKSKILKTDDTIDISSTIDIDCLKQIIYKFSKYL